VPPQYFLVPVFVQHRGHEAGAPARLLGVTATRRRTILLVTNAYHMPRARKLFADAGFVVKPFPVGFLAAENGGLFGAKLVPSVGALKQSEIALHEFYGRAFNRLRAVIGR
jgi:uncharacterized SAM-binding protein YcdF (DUF218 family)